MQRTANPGPASDFSPWTRLDTAATACNVAVCSHGASVLVFFRDPSNARVVRVRESADSGATWAARRTAATLASGAVDWLATSFSAAGTPALFLAAKRRPPPRNDPHRRDVERARAHDYALADITGLACDYDTAWRLAVTGSDATGRHRLWSASYDGAWSPLLEITRADAGSGVTFDAPFLRLADVPRLTVVERYTGAGGYRRPLMFSALADTPYDANSWADPVPFPADAPYGVAIAGPADALWLSTPDGVWHAALDTDARDLSADVLWLTMRESPSGGTVTLALRNDDARYNDVGDPDAALREGTELRVSPGYLTPRESRSRRAPPSGSPAGSAAYGGGEATLVVHAADGWALLAGWRARRQFAWARGEAAMASILGFILQRVGLGLQSTNPSAAMLSHRPSFTVHPGETGATAVRRLMAMAPDLLHFRGREAFVRQPQPTDAVSYAFGSYHPVHHMRLAASAPDATRVQVFGADGRRRGHRLARNAPRRRAPPPGPRPQPGHPRQGRSPRRRAPRPPPARHRLRRAPSPTQLRPRAPRHRRHPPPKRRRHHAYARSRPRARLPPHRHTQVPAKDHPDRPVTSPDADWRITPWKC